MFFYYTSGHVDNVSDKSVTSVSLVHLFYNCTIRKALLSSRDCIVTIWPLISQISGIKTIMCDTFSLSPYAGHIIMIVI